MNIYDILYWLVTIIGIAAACGAVYTAYVLWTVHLSMGSLHSWLDKASNEYADYMEWERDRRQEARLCPGYATSPLNYYGVRFLIERRLFLVQYDLACALYRWRDESQHAAARQRMAEERDMDNHRTF